eukprot:4044172-Heterocapsa_arctica.AAC.1
MESIMLLTNRTAALETKLNYTEDDDISSKENNPDGPALKRRMMEGRRTASTYSAPSNASTRAPEANPAI